MKCQHLEVFIDDNKIPRVKCGPGGKYPGEIIQYMWICTECQQETKKKRKKKG